ncbi:MAG: hypothetical protein ABSD20_11085 [Terriglobales bacterium]|jgi:hypothetical protein
MRCIRRQPIRDLQETSARLQLAAKRRQAYVFVQKVAPGGSVSADLGEQRIRISQFHARE